MSVDEDKSSVFADFDKTTDNTAIPEENKEITIYHGSHVVVDKPQFGFGKLNNDYGQGFYCTEHLDKAREWAANAAYQRGVRHFGYANKYLLDTSDLKILDLSAQKYTALHWLEVLISHRTLTGLSVAIGLAAAKYLHKHFHVDLTGYDIVKGYRADDSYFTFAEAFLNGTITYSTLKKALVAGHLGEQIVLMSEKAFSSIRFVAENPVPGAIYYTHYISNDTAARRMVNKAIEADQNNITSLLFKNEETMFTIMQKGMTAKDVSLL